MLSPVLINKGQIKSDYLGEDIIDLLNLTFTFPKKFDFNVFKVTEEYIARPDLVSLDAYGDTIFSDVICKLNGISNPFELNEGQYLILPAPDNILDFTSNPPVSDMEDDVDYPTPTPKSKNSKRKANEAIVGDSRFKIDPNLGLIIY